MRMPPNLMWRDHQAAIDAKALATATEISLMWGRDRSQFVSRIQVAVTEAMMWLKPALARAPVNCGFTNAENCNAAGCFHLEGKAPPQPQEEQRCPKCGRYETHETACFIGDSKCPFKTPPGREPTTSGDPKMQPSREMPKYLSHKTVWALKIKSVERGAVTKLVFEDEGYAAISVSYDYDTKHQPEAGGYYVVYADGYKSFSPAKAFEEGYALTADIAAATKPTITGYRILSEAETALINEGKALAEQCGTFIAKLRQHPDSMRTNAPNTLGDAPLDQRWISIGATDLQRGFMALTRGIAQPTTF